MEHRAKHGLVVLALVLGLPLALFGRSVQAQGVQDEQADAADASVVTLDAIDVVGAAEDDAPIKIGNTAGASQEDIERRNASHVTDLINQISGTSMNSRYAAPEVSVGVQGIAGFGRVAQSLEGVKQDFQAFSKDIGQTGSIFIEPNFLRSIDVTRGVNTSINTLGSLGSSVDFRYLDVEDILFPDKGFGGMVRGTTGFSKYRNGQNPSGQFFLGGRSERWEAMIGASKAENEDYRLGSRFNTGDMLKQFHVTDLNMQFRDPINIKQFWVRGNCPYVVNGITGSIRDSMVSCHLEPDKLDALKHAIKSGAFPRTERKTDSQLLRVRHYFDDDFNQKLELFASASHAKLDTDQNPDIKMPDGDATQAYWGNTWAVGAEFNARVLSLKYTANVSDFINPDILLYRERQERKHRWKGIPASLAYGEDLHYFVDIQSTGIRLANASHFTAPLLGGLRWDTALEFRRSDKDVDSLDEDKWHQLELARRGRSYTAMEWDPNARTNTHSIAFNLSTESQSPWQASIGAGWQRVKLDIYSPAFQSGNIAQAGRFPTYRQFLQKYRNQGYSNREAIALAQAEARTFRPPFYIDAEKGNLSYMRYVFDDQQHRYDLKSASFALQYTRPGTGFTSYASIGYSERAPSSNEMYVSGAWMRQLFVANPFLEPEKNLSLQSGINYQKKAWLSPLDNLSIDLSYYRNRIRNHIDYGPIYMDSEGITANTNMHIANVNNLEAVIRHGLELNLAYRQPLFYVRSNLTVPLRHKNRQCNWQVPSGRAYHETNNTATNETIYTSTGKGQRLCYSGWNWMETGLIEPLRGSLTVALTPGQFEFGSTVHYRGKRRAAYYYLAYKQSSTERDISLNPLPDNDGWIYANLWPKTVKVDLFANWRISDRLKAGIYIANLTDQFDGNPTTLGYDFHPGRTVTANLEYRF